MSTVLHVGPSNSRGGMGSVIQLLDSEYPEGWNGELMPSHADGGWFAVLRAWWNIRRSLRKRLHQGGIDIVHIHTASRWSWVRKRMLIRIARKAKLPVILSIHSGDFDRHCMKNGKSVSAVCQDSGVYPVVLSNRWKQRLQQWIGESTVIPNPVPHVEPSVNRNRNSFLLMGRNVPMKGQKIVIDAAKILQQQGHQIELHLAGFSSKDAAVINHGWVENNEREELLSTCGTLLSPSEWEGLSMVVIEAMARGMPVLASNASEGVFTNSGKIVERSPEAFASSMLQMLDGDEWTEMAKMGPIEAERYDLSTIVRQWKTLYEKVVNES
ncbi:MAG: glycosyltransferase family 4 protein [Candidatus Thermoplasmatota archaeon]|nr:glycosyltransferase family 4 protein [Candidatus Thermoplasmatota archaeon]